MIPMNSNNKCTVINSGNSKKFGYAIVKELREKDFDVCPINPKINELKGVKV